MGERAKKKPVHLKEEKLHVRISEDDKTLIERAADFVGLNASAFVLEHALKAARRELSSSEKISLSEKDAKLFLNLLSNPPAPNNAMKEAFAEYEQKVVNKR